VVKYKEFKSNYVDNYDVIPNSSADPEGNLDGGNPLKWKI
jgi:hypothetical protein